MNELKVKVSKLKKLGTLSKCFCSGSIAEMDYNYWQTLKGLTKVKFAIITNLNYMPLKNWLA